jgi:acyl carrier protein
MITATALKDATNVKDLGIDMHVLIDDQDLASQGVDSLDMMKIALLVEEKFSVKIPDSAFANLKTINDIVQYINTSVR